VRGGDGSGPSHSHFASGLNGPLRVRICGGIVAYFVSGKCGTVAAVLE
jgi:hypothetical protein